MNIEVRVLIDGQEVHLEGSAQDIANRVLQLNPRAVEATAMDRIGFEGDCDTIPQAYLRTIAEMLV